MFITSAAEGPIKASHKSRTENKVSCNKRSPSSNASSVSHFDARKTAQNYGSFVALALGFILIKSVHTA